MLAETPPRLTVLASGLTPAQLRTAPNPGEWSANDVLAHMRSCADVWGNCIAEILAHDKPTIRAINPRTWIKRTDYPEQEFQPSLQAFTDQRADLLQLLTPLSPGDWSRSATVTGAGNVLQRTALSYADWLAHHERPHIKQIARIAKSLQP
jgi:hypothetical protein